MKQAIRTYRLPMQLIFPALLMAQFMSFSHCLAREPAALNNARLVDLFYRMNGRKTVWLEPSGKLQAALDALVDSARTYGLNLYDYHAAALSSIHGPAADSSEVWRLDRLRTDALLSLFRDVYAGSHIAEQVSYDELSRATADADDQHILNAATAAVNSGDLSAALAALEPKDHDYDLLKAALRNMPPDSVGKCRQLCASLNLCRWVRHFRYSQYIVVNIASATLRYYEGDTQKLISRIVVGKPATPTPRFAAHCDAVIFYPYWNVPPKIAAHELLPRFKKSPGAVDAMNMQVVDKAGHVVNHYAIDWKRYNGSNFPYSFRQCTGCDNSLGVIKFNITDPFDVYLHDTNTKKLFGSERRFYSHGCIRVEEAVALGNFLIPGKIDDAYLNLCLKDQKPETVPLARPVPVFVIYATAEAGELTNATYYNDVYRLFK